MVVRTFCPYNGCYVPDRGMTVVGNAFRVSIRPKLVGFNFDAFPCVYMNDVFVEDPPFTT